MKEKIVFFGAGPYVAPIIETLEKEFDIVLKISSKEKFDDQLINQLKSSGAKVAILASFGQIIPQSVLNIFEFGILNIHPSLLPKYRGPTPVQSAILAGKTQTGVSIIKLDSEVDHGPILAQEKISLNGTETAENLSEKLFLLGGEMIIKIVRKIGKGSPVIEKRQDHSKASFTEHLKRESGFVDINNPPKIEQLDRMIRAYYPWPGVWFRAKLNGKERSVKLLPGQKLQVGGKNAMYLRDFSNGYPEGKEILNRLDPDGTLNR